MQPVRVIGCSLVFSRLGPTSPADDQPSPPCSDSALHMCLATRHVVTLDMWRPLLGLRSAMESAAPSPGPTCLRGRTSSSSKAGGTRRASTRSRTGVPRIPPAALVPPARRLSGPSAARLIKTLRRPTPGRRWPSQLYGWFERAFALFLLLLLLLPNWVCTPRTLAWGSTYHAWGVPSMLALGTTPSACSVCTHRCP